MKQPRPCLFPDCGLSKSASIHWGSGDDKHAYEGERRPSFGAARKPLSPRSERPNRVARREESLSMMQAHRQQFPACEAPGRGIQTPCGEGLDATVEQHHIIGRGLGGGKDYGELASLCRKHHREVDTDRESAKKAGLYKRPPTSAVPRRQASSAPSQVPQHPIRLTVDRPPLDV